MAGEDFKSFKISKELKAEYLALPEFCKVVEDFIKIGYRVIMLVSKEGLKLEDIPSDL